MFARITYRTAAGNCYVQEDLDWSCIEDVFGCERAILNKKWDAIITKETAT